MPRMIEQLKNTYTHRTDLIKTDFNRTSTEGVYRGQHTGQEQKNNKRSKGGKKSTDPPDCEVKL